MLSFWVWTKVDKRHILTPWVLCTRPFYSIYVWFCKLHVLEYVSFTLGENCCLPHYFTVVFVYFWFHSFPTTVRLRFLQLGEAINFPQNSEMHHNLQDLRVQTMWYCIFLINGPLFQYQVPSTNYRQRMKDTSFQILGSRSFFSATSS